MQLDEAKQILKENGCKITESWADPEIKVGELKEILQDAIDYLDDYEDDDIVNLQPNNYKMNRPLLELYNGFLSLNDIDVEEAESGSWVVYLDGHEWDRADTEDAAKAIVAGYTGEKDCYYEYEEE